MKPRTVPSNPSNGAICAMVASKFNFCSSRGTSHAPASSSTSRTASRPRSRLRIASLTRRATGPGVASQMARASTTFSRLRTLRTPLRNSMELICSRWYCRSRSSKNGDGRRAGGHDDPNHQPALREKPRQHRDVIRVAGARD